MANSAGFVISRFMPLHAGHEYLIAFARNFVSDVTVILQTSPFDVIDAHARAQWLQELAPGCRILDAAAGSEQYVAASCGAVPEFLFSNNNGDRQLADSLGCRFVPVDPMIDVSEELILEDPLAHWNLLSPCSRYHFVRRVCVFGPESTGKSTLAINLARHFNTVSVPEYARTHIDSRNNELCADDIAVFARGQIASEKALARKSNRVMFCDTDAIITSIWSDWLYGSCPDSVIEAADGHDYDLYLLTDVDVPWVADPQRYLPEQRQSFFDRCKQELENRKRKYVVITGDWDNRFNQAVKAVEELMACPQKK